MEKITRTIDTKKAAVVVTNTATLADYEREVENYEFCR